MQLEAFHSLTSPGILRPLSATPRHHGHGWSVQHTLRHCVGALQHVVVHRQFDRKHRDNGIPVLQASLTPSQLYLVRPGKCAFCVAATCAHAVLQFTVFESFSLGLIVSYTSQVVVLQALVITVFTFLGLTLFTFQSKYDFSKMGPWLFGGLLFLVGAGFVQIFLPFSHVVDLAFAAGGCLIFSGYILYDTHMILKRLSPEEWVFAVLSL